MGKIRQTQEKVQNSLKKVKSQKVLAQEKVQNSLKKVKSQKVLAKAFVKVKEAKEIKNETAERRKKINEKILKRDIIKLSKDDDNKKEEPKKEKFHPLKKRGVVYIGHIPNGFLEAQLKKYFKQFGVVTKVRVARSKKTGRSKGYAYVEFLHTEVAKVAAESMNNYLMCNRLLKASYIPPENQKINLFIGKNYTLKDYPKLTNRKKELNINRKHTEDNVIAKKKKDTLKKLSDLEEKLKAKGVNLKLTALHAKD